MTMRRKAQPGMRTYIPYDKATGEGGYKVYTPHGAAVAKLIVAAFNGRAPRFTKTQWLALRRARKRLGRMLNDNEAREVIRRVR